MLDPSYTPVDVRPRKKIFITLSFDDLPRYENGLNSSSVAQIMSEEPHHNTTPGIDSSFELPEMSMTLHSTKVENEDSIKRTTEENTAINIALNNDCPSKDEFSSHFIGFSDAYIYSNEEDNETKAVGYVESTELELPSLSCEYPEFPADLHFNSCFTAIEAETLTTSPYIEDCLNCAQEHNSSSHNIDCFTASPSHDSPTDVLFAFELVDGAMCNAANPHSSSSEFVCDSSDSIPKSTITTSLPELIIAKPSPPRVYLN